MAVVKLYFTLKQINFVSKHPDVLMQTEVPKDKFRLGGRIKRQATRRELSSEGENSSDAMAQIGFQ